MSVARFILLALPLAAATLPAPPTFAAVADSIAYAVRVANGNLVGVTVSNYGFIGNNFVSRSPSLEYPLGSGFEHLVRGGLWIGAHAVDAQGPFIGVTTAALDGAQGTASAPETEFTPAGNSIRVRSSLTHSIYYDPNAVSEQDLIGEFSDRPAKRAANNPEAHRPLNVLVRQQNYAWSLPGFEHVVIFHETIVNLGDAPLTDAWVGVYAELKSGSKNDYACWPPSSFCSPQGSWYGKSWLQYDAPLRMIREHYCRAQPIPGGCNLAHVPHWMGIQMLTPPDPARGQHVTLAAWAYAPGSPLRDQDVERYAIMSAGTVQDLSQPDLLPQTGDPVELLALGPFAAIAPGDSIVVDFALVGGGEVADVQAHAAQAQALYEADYQIGVVPTLLSLVDADARADGVRLTWHSATSGLVASVQRAESGGDWRAIGEAAANGSGLLVFEDREVSAGGRYGYRLAVREGGSERMLGEVWVEIPGAARLGLEGLRPHPARRGALTVAFSLASGEPARLEMLDLSGRRMFTRAVASPAAGPRLMRLSGAERVPPGTYVLRLSQGGRSVATLAVVLP